MNNQSVGTNKTLGSLNLEQLHALVERQKKLYATEENGGIDIDEGYNCYYFKKDVKQYRKEVIWDALGLGDYAKDCDEDFIIACQVLDWNESSRDKKVIQDTVDGWEQVGSRTY